MRGSGRCARHRPAANLEFVDMTVDSPEDAVTAVMLSLGPTEPPQAVFLLCDRDRRVQLAVSVDGACPADAPSAAERVVAAIDDGWLEYLAVGLVVPGDSTDLAPADVVAVLGLSQACQHAGLRLLQVVVIAGRNWRSILSAVVGLPDWGNNGNQ